VVSVHEVGCASRVPTRPPSVFALRLRIARAENKSRAATQQWGLAVEAETKRAWLWGGMCYEEQLEKTDVMKPLK